MVFVPVVNKDGTPKIDPESRQPKTRQIKDTSEWDERSKAFGDSSATGMTQFLDGSWVSLAFTEGTRLNQWVRGKGWLTTKNVTIERKRKRRNRKTGKMETVTVKTEKSKLVFVLSNGSLVFSKKDDLPGSLAGILSCKPYMAGRRTATDKHLQEILDLRYVPEHAIFAAVDYAVSNLSLLGKDGYSLESLNDGEKAKIMYAAHHLGEGDVKKFIENTMTSKRAEKLLITQVGVKDAKKELNDAGANWVKAHRAWLKRYIERKIKIGNFMCDPTQAPATRDLLALADYLKNNKVK